MKILIVITLLLSLNFLMGFFFGRNFKIRFDGKDSWMFLVVMVASLIYQTYYWLDRFKII